MTTRALEVAKFWGRSPYTSTDVPSLIIPSSVEAIGTAGFTTAGDGGGARYRKKLVIEVDRPGDVTSADGARWGLARGQDIHVEMFGAVAYTQDELEALNGAASIDAVAAINPLAFQNAADLLEIWGGGTFYGKGQFYIFLEQGWRWPDSVYFEGAGHGKWLPSFPTEAKTWEGTNLVAKGTGTRDYTATGITSGEFSGGWRTDPDNAARKFKLTSFMNRDASGTTAATPKAMAVFIANKGRHGDKGGVSKCRVVPWIGVDGISTYSTQTGNDLGADWDIGVLIDTMEGVRVHEVQVRGYWRMIGLAEVSPDFDTWSRSEANIITDSSATGFVGVAIRSGTQHKIIASTSDSVTIKWDAESIWPPSGQVNLINAGYIQYTSLSRSGDNLVFNGLSADPAGSLYLRNPYRGTGFSTGAFFNVEGWGLWHHSGQSAEALGFDRPSTGFEASGFPMRGLNFFNCSWFGETLTSPAMHLHNVFDFNFHGGKAEIGHVIASAIESAQELPTTAAGSTNNLGLHGFQFTSSVDSRMFTPRSVRDAQRQWNPLERNSGDFLLEALPDQELQLRTAAGKNFRLVRSTGDFGFTMFDSGTISIAGSLNVGTTTALINSAAGQAMSFRQSTTTRMTITAAGSVTPGADATQNFGASGLAWNNSFFAVAPTITSDERTKQGLADDPDHIKPVRDDVLDAWGDVHWGEYRVNESVEHKSDGARIHVGLVAQRVLDAFQSRGLDPFVMALLCYDEWEDEWIDEEEEVTRTVHLVDDQGELTGETVEDVEFVKTGRQVLHVKAGNQFGLRYDECQAMEAAYQRRRADRFEARLAALEAAVSAGI